MKNKIREILLASVYNECFEDIELNMAVEELFNLIEEEKKDFWCDIALYVAKKKVDWYMDFVSYGAEKLGLKVCEDCKEKLDELIKEN
jgi:hypothetical protein